MKRFASLVAAAATFSTAASALSTAETVANLRVAQTQVDRIKQLGDDTFVFDFLHSASGISTGAGGHTVAASSENMPALVGNGMAMTIGFLGPCGMNTPHTHPRATEFNFAVNGSLKGGFLAENGARFVMHDIPPGSAAVFPQGAIHFEYNDGCEDMLFVAAFNHEDPGVLQVAQRFYGLPPNIVAAALGGIGVEEVAGLESKIPNNVALGTAECLQRCGIKSANGQPTDQRQPRLPANALPAGFSGPSAAAATPTTVTRSLGLGSTSVVEQPGPQGNSASGGVASNDTADHDNKPSALTIALIVVVSVLAAGYIVIAALYFRSRQSQSSRAMGNKYVKTGSTYAPEGLTVEKQPFESFSPERRSMSTPYDPPASSQ
ncbi:RmlC-like cupin domain-containing protein [Irpex lacteus]|nr:RmlC-like cupin domain-containing protein [Irpex lacteus]